MKEYEQEITYYKYFMVHYLKSLEQALGDRGESSTIRYY